MDPDTTAEGGQVAAGEDCAVTFTAVAGLNEKKAAAMNEHAPALDFVGINTYGALAVLRRFRPLLPICRLRPYPVSDANGIGTTVRAAVRSELAIR